MDKEDKEDKEDKVDIAEQVLQQSPVGVEKEKISKLLETYDGDCLKVLSILWDLGDDEVSNVQVSDDNDKGKKKWEDIRDICNTYEEEMQNFMKSKQN